MEPGIRQEPKERTEEKSHSSILLFHSQTRGTYLQRSHKLSRTWYKPISSKMKIWANYQKIPIFFLKFSWPKKSPKTFLTPNEAKNSQSNNPEQGTDLDKLPMEERKTHGANNGSDLAKEIRIEDDILHKFSCRYVPTGISR